jgi:hypothetical protein
LNGNTRPPGGTRRPDEAGWQTAGARPLEPRKLQEEQTAATLRAAGWTLPGGVKPEARVRVYDTRLDPAWLQRLRPELGHALPEELATVGGDFLTEPRPLCEDTAALDPLRLRPWAPSSDPPKHLLVLPRPHQVAWLERSRLQLPIEAPGTAISVCCIVDRSLCADAWDAEAVRRALPGSAQLLKDTEVEVSVTAVGERPILRRVPAHEKTLPPPRWERAHLALNRVLLVVTMRLRAGRPPATSTSLGHWAFGIPPTPEPSAMELLRVEYILPPATRQQQAERSLWAALRETAKLMSLAPPAKPQLRQVQLEHGGAVGILEVPRGCAREWLRGSGCGGLFLRPFWTKDTGKEVDRANFSLLWLRGLLPVAETVWGVVRDAPGVFGLLPGGQDIAVRITTEADSACLQRQVQFALRKTHQNVAFRRADPNLRWWRLGPLTSAESAAVHLLISSLGLTVEGDAVRFKPGNLTRTRCYAYFCASGEPERRSLDDGGWHSSQAHLEPALPPPRRQTTARSAFAPARAPAPRPGPALTAHSTWGDASRRPPPQHTATLLPPPPAQPARPPPATPSDPLPRGRHRRRAPAERTEAPVSRDDELFRLIRELQAELTQMRQDNERLRHDLAVARASPWVHQPYAPAVAPLQTDPASPAPLSTPERRGSPPQRPTSPAAMPMVIITESPQKPVVPEAKRHRSASVEVSPPDDV